MPPNWMAFKTTHNPGKYNFSSFSHCGILLLTPYFDRERMEQASFWFMNVVFILNAPCEGNANGTQDICKFTCIPREGKWGLVLRFLDQAPWVRRLRKEVSVTELQRTSCLRRERRDVGCHTAPSIPEPAYKSECSCQAKGRSSMKERPSLAWGRPGHRMHTAG